MEAQLPQDVQPVSAVPPRKRRQHKRRPRVLVPKQAPYTRDNLDKRTLASKAFDAQIAAIKADLGNDNLTTIECQLIENFAAISVAIEAMIVDLLLGKPVNVIELSQLCSTSVRIGGRLGLRRRPRDVSQPQLSEYLSGREDEPDRDESLPHLDGSRRRAPGSE
jgi:hypothetical protein